jgi:methionyl-tRNA formyltransferase
VKDKRVVFMGTPLFAVPVLEELIKNTNVVLVVTQPDKPVGRHKESVFTPIKEVAVKNGIPVFQPEKIRNDYEEVLNAKPDIIITCAYGQIIPKVLLDTPKYEAVNVHASLLPKLRGGAPIHKAIIYGEKETGITIMYMSEKMDAGDIIKQESIPIMDCDNVGTIHDKLMNIGSKLLIQTLPSIFDGTNDRIKQDEEKVTYAYNVSREEEKIDFNKSNREVFNQIRGLYPYPVAYTTLNGEVIKITESKMSDSEEGTIGEITMASKNGICVKCFSKSIVITRLKPAGKKEMSVSDFINGYKGMLLGERFE